MQPHNLLLYPQIGGLRMSILVQAALIVIVVRSAYMAFKLFDNARKAWLELLYHISVAIVALSVLL